MAKLYPSASAASAKPALSASTMSALNVVLAQRAETTLRFSSNSKRTQDSESTTYSAAERAAYSRTTGRSALVN